MLVHRGLDFLLNASGLFYCAVHCACDPSGSSWWWELPRYWTGLLIILCISENLKNWINEKMLVNHSLTTKTLVWPWLYKVSQPAIFHPFTNLFFLKVSVGGLPLSNFCKFGTSVCSYAADSCVYVNGYLKKGKIRCLLFHFNINQTLYSHSNSSLVPGIALVLLSVWRALTTETWF